MTRLIRISLISLIMAGFTLLQGIGIREQRDYDYILDLYTSQHDQEALMEIEAFISSYPSSELMNSICFIEAQVLFYQARFPEALALYASLAEKNMNPEDKAELLLNYGISAYYTRDYQLALRQLQILSSDYDIDDYKARAAMWMARIFSDGAQFYSAEKYYRIALETFPRDADLRLELYSVLLNLDNTDEALALMSRVQTSDSNFFRYLESLLAYYLNQELYSEFDQAIGDYQLEDNPVTDRIILLMVRRSLVQNNYTAAASQLDLLSTESPQSIYYKAVVLNSQSQIAQADSIFASLVNSDDPDIALLSYMERLKIIYQNNPQSAFEQVQSFIEANPGADYMGELSFLAGYFAFHRDDYLGAIKHLNRSRNYDLNKYQADRLDALLAESWMRLERWDQADERFNRYLNLHPQGLHRDRAWFNLGLIAFQRKDYNQSRMYFQNLLSRHPESPILNEARFYLAELDFYQANYNLAALSYRSLLNKHPQDDSIRLRLAQTHYFNQQYNSSLALLDSLTVVDYDSYLLAANVYFNTRAYQSALDKFQLAYNYAADDKQKMESQSYIALTLYQLGRFNEASGLYLQLAGEEANPDTYLFLAAKSAMQSGSTQQAIELYERFLDTYPESDHLYAVLADMATIDYNLGNYSQSFENWKSLLRRFSSKLSFSASDRLVLKEAFNGLELCLLRDEGLEAAESLIDLSETFASDYIRFELQYIIVKLYAARSQWQALLREAESIRALAGFEQKNEIELLMVESLIQLNQTAEATSLLEDVYQATQSNEALLKLAEIKFLESNYQEAARLYSQSFGSTHDPKVWLKLLESSQYNAFSEFQAYWEMGEDLVQQLPSSLLYRMDYLIYNQSYDEARNLADTILNTNLTDYQHARAYLSLAEADYKEGDYLAALRSLNRIRSLFPDFVDLNQKASYLQIRALINSGAITEAQLRFAEDRLLLSEEQFEELSSYFEGLR